MTWPISTLFKINDMTQYILCVEIYIINIGQCHNIFNVLYVVKSALNTVCVLYIYWNITQEICRKSTIFFFHVGLLYILWFCCSLPYKAFFFHFSFFLFPSFLLACFFACFLFLACLFFPPLFLNKVNVTWKTRTDFVVFYCLLFS